MYPRFWGGRCVFQISSFADLVEGYRGILEPKTTVPYADSNGQYPLICLPGAAFDRACHRIGYGGGFYDRYLSGLFKNNGPKDREEHPQARISTVALSFACQIYEEIPWEVHDVRPSFVITEREIIER